MHNGVQTFSGVCLSHMKNTAGDFFGQLSSENSDELQKTHIFVDRTSTLTSALIIYRFSNLVCPSRRLRQCLLCVWLLFCILRYLLLVFSVLHPLCFRNFINTLARSLVVTFSCLTLLRSLQKTSGKYPEVDICLKAA